jgi:hypothetical protein
VRHQRLYELPDEHRDLVVLNRCWYQRLIGEFSENVTRARRLRYKRCPHGWS